MNKCYVVRTSDETDDWGVYRIVCVCKTEELANAKIDELKRKKLELSRVEMCRKCSNNGYTIDGKHPDCFLDVFGDNDYCDNEDIDGDVSYYYVSEEEWYE